jgi:hypothetical protein
VSRLRVLSIATLYPNDLTPNFGVFVERQMQAVVKRGDVDLVLLNPIGLPPFPLSLHPRYRGLGDLPQHEERGGVSVLRPHFRLLPGIGGRFNAGAVTRAVLPLAEKLHAEAPFDLVDAQFFHPDGSAAVNIAKALGLPSSVKARGADIQFWGKQPGVAQQVLAAGRDATGLLAVSAGLIDDMAALGIDPGKVTVHRTGLNADLFRPYDPAQGADLCDRGDAAVAGCNPAAGGARPRRGRAQVNGGAPGRGGSGALSGRSPT